MDAATEAVQNGFFKCFKRDLFSYPVKKLVSLFDSEALAGDLLTVKCWQDRLPALKDTIYFCVIKDDTYCFFCSIQFYMENMQSKL